MSYDNIGQLINEKIQNYHSNTALRYKSGDAWLSLTYKEFGAQIHQLASALLRADVKAGDNVAIYSANRYEWAVTDFACALIGAVSVPIYATNTLEQAEYIVKDASIHLVFTGDEPQYQNVSAIRTAEYPLQIVSYDPILAVEGTTDSTFEDFIRVDVTKLEQDEIRRRLEQIDRNDLTTIIYTSGTTGSPKGVMLSHENLFHQFDAVDANFTVTSEDVSLCFLPLSHVYERMWSYFVYLKGATQTYLNDPRQVIDTMQEIRPTAMVSVPRLYEKIYATVQNRQESASSLKKAIFRKAIQTGSEYYTRSYAKKSISTGLKLRHWIFDKLVLSKVREVVGGDKNFFSAGGAPLEKDIEEFFFNCGLLICQGYGLTETSPMISYNTPTAFKFGTVGKLVPGCEVRIGDDGEIQAKGPNIMKGYYNNPEATANSFDEGWFRTGDVGEFDEDGYLKITDRIKDLIITSGGKNIAPLRIETLVGKDFFVDQIIAIGDNRNFISALIVPAFEGLEEWARKKKIMYESMDELVDHPKVRALYEKRIQLQSKLLAQYEKIKNFRLLSTPFTMEGGDITPTLKLRRKQINEKFKALIDSMYHKNG